MIPAAPPDFGRRRLFAVLLLACAVLTLGGYALKAQCKHDYNADRDRLLCSNDIQVLYGLRGIDHRQFPYIHGRLDHGRLVGGAIEYPVLTGVAAWFPGLFVHDGGAYLTATALVLAPFTFLTTWLLGRMVRWRALLYAAAPPLVWYSFHNWDLLVVAATVGAFHQWWRGRSAAAAALLAVGGALKLWPAFFIVPLVLERLTARDRGGAGRATGAFVLVTLGVNLPFLLANPAGWWAPYAFQKERAADITSNSIWFWGLPDLSVNDLNRLVPVLLAAAFVAAAAYGSRRAAAEGAYPFLQVSGAMLAAFLLLNKAHSPQYALWLLPFFALLRLRWGWFTAYMCFDALLYVGLFHWYDDLSHGRDFGIAKQMLVLGVWGRAVMLALLFVAFLRSTPSTIPAPTAGAPAGPAEPAAAPVAAPA